ncbi:MAG: hypothetical protein J6B87_07210 [Clostridia bacterium]|nr:hypothetical protein [Clostridia bacterium]
MVQTSLNNPGKHFTIPTGASALVKSHIAKRHQEDQKVRKLSRVRNAGKKKADSVIKGSGGSSSESSSGSGITTGEDAAEDTLSGGGSSGGDSSGEDYSGGDSSGSGDSGSSSGATSPLLEGSMSFEELIGEICNGIDLIFAVKRSVVVISDYSSIYAEAKYLRDNYHSSVQAEDIALWQLEDGTYELDVNEYGFYNTVKVHYKNGTVTESYEDLVRVYGEVTKEYEDKKADKTTAIMKAKAYLAAHVRDFDMSVKANLLHDADIDIGDIVTLENPMTMRDAYRQSQEKRDPEYLFVTGNSISWDGEGPILNSLELRYGAVSPDKKEVPETGTGGYLPSSEDESSSFSSDVDEALQDIGKRYHTYTYCHTCQTASCVKQHKCGDCYGLSDFLSCELTQRGVTNKILQYHSDHSQSGTHRTVRYKDKDGTWKDFPYKELGFSGDFGVTSYIKNNKTIPSTCGDNS